MEPSYKQHTAVDDHAGVIVDVHVTTGEASEGKELEAQIERVEALTGAHVETATADAAYGHGSNYGGLEQRKTEAIIPPQRRTTKQKTIPLQQFKYDPKNGVVRCPAGRIMGRPRRVANGWMYHAQTSDCRRCALRLRCVPPSAKRRVVLIVDHYPSLLRARRRYVKKDERWKTLYRRHRSMVEGVHGESKAQHGLHRAARRTRWNVAVQAYLTAAVINLKRLAKASLRAWWEHLVHAADDLGVIHQAFIALPDRAGSDFFRIIRLAA